MLQVQDIAKAFGRTRAVAGLSFTLERGEVVGLLGPNGAGKTTTIRMITGLLPPDSGRVAILGHDTLSDSVEARRCVGYLPESAPLYPEMKVADYLDYRARLFGLDRARRRAAVAREIDRCRLAEVRARRIGKLSKGYRQRVGLAAALVHEPAVLVLDEPTDGLDPGQVRQVRQLIAEASTACTMLISSHVLAEVERICTRVLVIAGGALKADGPPARLGGIGELRRFVVELRAEGDAPPEDVLAKLSFVESVSREPLEESWVRLTVTAAKDAPDLREPLARAAAGAGFTIRELRSEAAGLERVFLSLVGVIESSEPRAEAEA